MTVSSSLARSVCGVTVTVNDESVGELDGADAGLLGLALERLGGVVALGFHRVGRVDLQDEVNASPKVEPQLDGLLQGVLDRGIAVAHHFLLGVPVARPDVAGDGAHHHQQDQEDSPAKLLTQIPSRKKRTAQSTGEAYRLSAISGASSGAEEPSARTLIARKLWLTAC